MKNVFIDFWDWLTYNPNNIALYQIAKPVILFSVTLFIILLVYFSMFNGKITRKTVIISALSTLNFEFAILWEAYTLGCNKTLFVELVPIYPLIIILALLIAVKAYRRQKNTLIVQEDEKLDGQKIQ